VLHGWDLLASPYVVRELENNLYLFPSAATTDWQRLHGQLIIINDIVTVDRAVIFPAAKDRPILFTALAHASVLLTLDRADFGELLGNNFYGLPILSPAAFLDRERRAGRLKQPLP
jgi:hypothetical protein